jgi:hypothetical protein
MDNEQKLRYIYNWENFISLLNEGLIHTYPIKTVVKLITNELSRLKLLVSIDTEISTNTIFVKGYSKTFYNKDIKHFISVISLCGYFPSTFKFYNKKDELIDKLIYENIDDEFLKTLNEKILNSYFTQITIESKFNKIVNVPNKLYHVTLCKNTNRILKYGLISKNNNKRAYHIERIYFGYNKIITKNLAYQFDEKSKYILLEIDTIGLNIIFYDDPDFTNDGCYTYDNISPNRIKILEQFENF